MGRGVGLVRCGFLNNIQKDHDTKEAHWAYKPLQQKLRPKFREERIKEPTSIVAISTFATAAAAAAAAAAGSSLVRIDYPLSSSSLHSILTVSSNLCVV